MSTRPGSPVEIETAVVPCGRPAVEQGHATLWRHMLQGQWWLSCIARSAQAGQAGGFIKDAGWCIA